MKRFRYIHVNTGNGAITYHCEILQDQAEMPQNLEDIWSLQILWPSKIALIVGGT